MSNLHLLVCSREVLTVTKATIARNSRCRWNISLCWMMALLSYPSTQLFDRAIAFRVDCSHYFAARANCKQVMSLLLCVPPQKNIGLKTGSSLGGPSPASTLQPPAESSGDPTAHSRCLQKRFNEIFVLVTVVGSFSRLHSTVFVRLFCRRR